jgi:formamidopyrimidine-DNA glycosylase
MSGNLTVTEHGVEPDAKRSKSAVTGGGYAYRKHDHVVFATEHATITFNDPRRFGLVLLIPTHQVEEHDLFRHLGPEPLSDDFTATILRQKLHNKKIALKVALMDQRTVVGVGNIYASEALFRAKLNPKLPAGKLTAKQAEILVSSIKQVLAEAIEAGGSSLRDFKHSSGQLGYFQHNFRVYDRKGEPCPTCQTPIKQATMGQRSTYWCPTCQSSR